MTEENEELDLSEIIDSDEYEKAKESFIEHREKKSKDGRDVLSVDIFKKVAGCLKACMSINGTCKYVGIARSTWYLWKQKAERDKEQLYIDFFKMVDESLGYAEFRLLVEIQKDKSWQAKHAILRRRFSKDWSEKQEIELKGKSEVKHDFTGMSLEERKQLLLEIVKAEQDNEATEQDNDD